MIKSLLIFSILVLTLGCNEHPNASTLNEGGNRVSLDTLLTSIKNGKFYDRDVRKNAVALLRELSDDGDALFPKSIDKLMSNNTWTNEVPSFARDKMIKSEKELTDIAHLSNSVIFATKDVEVSHAANVVAVAYGKIDMGHVNTDNEPSCLLISPADIEVSFSTNCIIFSGGNVKVSFVSGSRIYAKGDITISHGEENAASYVLSEAGKVDVGIGKGIVVKKRAESKE